MLAGQALSNRLSIPLAVFLFDLDVGWCEGLLPPRSLYQGDALQYSSLPILIERVDFFVFSSALRSVACLHLSSLRNSFVFGVDGFGVRMVPTSEESS